MLKVQSKEIGGTVFEVQQHPARRALRLVARVGRLGKALGGVLEGAMTGKGRRLADLDVGVVLEAIGAVFDVLTPDEQDAFFAELFACTAIVESSGQRVPLWPVFDARMQGRALDVYSLAFFVLEVNFRDFFDGLASVPVPAGVVPSPSPST